MADVTRTEHDLFERIGQKANKEPLRALLAEYQGLFPNQIHLSGSKPDLVEELKSAVLNGHIPGERALALLQECEENGSQIVLYYSPATAAIRQKCCDSESVAATLFGTDWRGAAGFPKLTRLTQGYEVVDFRTQYMGKPNDWIMKIYTYQETRVQVRQFDDAQMVLKGVVGLKETEYLVVYDRRVTESVCVARWNDDPRHGLLEVRVELSGRLNRFETDVNAVWTRLRLAFDRDNDFEPWEFERPQERMLRECTLHPTMFQLGLAHFVDSGEGGIRYVPYTEHDTLDASPIRLQTITQILDDGGRCSRLAMTWLPEGSEDVLEDRLRTYAGSRRTNELVIPAQTTASAVDYVTDRLRYFAG